MYKEIDDEMSHLSERFPEKEPSDRAHDAFRLVLSTLPTGAPLELFNLVLAPPLSRRRDEWLLEVATVVDDIRQRTKDFDFRTLQENEQFISATMEATKIAMSSHQQEKRRILHNALVKIGTVCNIDEDLQFVYLRLVDDLTPTHVKILDLFWRGNSRLSKAGYQFPMSSTDYERHIENLFPELRNKRHFVDQILQDLRSRGLCNAQAITSGMSGGVMTNHGIGFLGFVLLEPDEVLS